MRPAVSSPHCWAPTAIWKANSFPKNPAVRGIPASEAIARGGEGEKRRPFREPAVGVEILPDDDRSQDGEDEKGEERHEKVGPQVERDHRRGSESPLGNLHRCRSQRHEEEPAVADRRVGEEALQVLLRKGREIADEEGDDRNDHEDRGDLPDRTGLERKASRGGGSRWPRPLSSQPKERP